MKSIVLIVAVLACSTTAEACLRCGNFRRCSYRSYPIQNTVAQKAYYEPPPQPQPIIQTFVFRDSAPPTQSVYGYGAAYQPAVAAYQTSAKELLQVTSEVNTTVQGLAQLAGQQLALETEINRVNSAANGLVGVINAARESTAQATTSQAWVLQMRNGEIQRFERLGNNTSNQPVNTGQQYNTGQPPNGGGQPVAGNGGGGILTVKCGSCHGAELTSPAGGLFVHDSATLSSANITKFLNWARNPNEPTIPEKMRPLMGALTNQEKAQLMDALLDREGA